MQLAGFSLLILRQSEYDGNHFYTCCVEEKNNWNFTSSSFIQLRGIALSFSHTFVCWYDCLIRHTNITQGFRRAQMWLKILTNQQDVWGFHQLTLFRQNVIRLEVNVGFSVNKRSHTCKLGTFSIYIFVVLTVLGCSTLVSRPVDLFFFRIWNCNLRKYAYYQVHTFVYF